MLKRHRSNAKAGSLIGALDIGSSKVCCLIMVGDTPDNLRLIGFGHHRTQGIKAGVVLDPEQVERSARAAVAQAERMAGVTLERVLITVACGRLKSANFIARATLTDRVVGRGDIARVQAAAEAFVGRSGRTIIQLVHGGWRLDGAGGARDPLGMAGSELSLAVHAVTADEPPLRNLLHVIERCYLETEGVIAAPYASALAVTTGEERRQGVLCIDFGGGTTTLAMFMDGQFVYADSVPVGGSHISYDIARELATPLAEAERIKTLYGTLVPAASDEREVITFPGVDDDDGASYETTKARLGAIIEARIESIYGLVAERVAASRLEHLAAGSIVLTGGAGQMMGLAEWWASRSGVTTRTGRPRPVGGMAANLCTPPFAAAAGLVLAALSPDAGIGAGLAVARAAAGEGYFGRLRGWVRESF
jgi:cell division protein FtsA